MPSPAFPRNVCATTSSLASALPLIAAATCAAVLETAPLASVARLTRMSFPDTSTDSGEFATPGSRNSAVMSLPPS
jgi:hypothetical protein